MRKVAFVAVFLLGFCTWAMAADVPKAELFGGYSFYSCNSDILKGSCNLNGFTGAASANATKWIGAVGEINANYGSVDNANSVKVISFLLGPRVYLRKFDRFTPFAHALVGDSYINAKNNRERVTKEHDFTLAVGGGIDLKVAKKITVRPVQLDYVTVDQKHYSRLNNVRYSVGIVFTFGEQGD
jgi:opacity protein-like surface antigen